MANSAKVLKKIEAKFGGGGGVCPTWRHLVSRLIAGYIKHAFFVSLNLPVLDLSETLNLEKIIFANVAVPGNL